MIVLCSCVLHRQVTQVGSNLDRAVIEMLRLLNLL